MFEAKEISVTPTDVCTTAQRALRSGTCSLPVSHPVSVKIEKNTILVESLISRQLLIKLNEFSRLQTSWTIIERDDKTKFAQNLTKNGGFWRIVNKVCRVIEFMVFFSLKS